MSIQEFATLPQVAINVLNMLKDDDSFNIKELANLIETDASLTIKLIKVANSPMFGITTSVSSVQQAILTLGLNRVSNIAIGIVIFSKFIHSSDKDVKVLMEEYWNHNAAVGVVSKSLAKRAGFNFKELEFIGGLLHDIGKLAMMQFDNFEMYRNVIDIVRSRKKTDYEAEERIFGMTHCDVGKEIATRWKLPDALSAIIGSHRDFTETKEEYKTIVAVVYVSNLLCDVWGSGFYEGTNSLLLEELPAWKYIVEKSEKDLDIEEVTFD